MVSAKAKALPSKVQITSMEISDTTIVTMRWYDWLNNNHCITKSKVHITSMEILNMLCHVIPPSTSFYHFNPLWLQVRQHHNPSDRDSSVCLCNGVHTPHDGDPQRFPSRLASPLGRIPKQVLSRWRLQVQTFLFRSFNWWRRLIGTTFTFPTIYIYIHFPKFLQRRKCKREDALFPNLGGWQEKEFKALLHFNQCSSI